MNDKTPISQLPGLGPASAKMLARAGINTLGELQRLGSVAAFAQTKQAGEAASLNLLWALEAALSNLTWQEVARQHRTSLLLALDEYQARRR